jgi:hypothetical protein
VKIARFKGQKFDAARKTSAAQEARLADLEAKAAKNKADIDELKKKGGAK